MNNAARPTDKAKTVLADDLRGEGFDAVAVTSARAPEQLRTQLQAFVDAGHHGQMTWLAETLARRSDPQVLWPQAQSIILVAMNYGPENSRQSLEMLERKNKGTISVYAQNRDYHDVVKGKLKQVAGRFAARYGAQVKVFVDTAPVMEKPLAQSAGLGWQGKHTNLVSRSLGSWFFLGSIFTDRVLEPDPPESDHCGQCRACLDACPTNAFTAPYQLDAQRCISYLTIEHQGPIPLAFRTAMGNRIYGCDDCLAVCPWNKFAQQASQAKLQARNDLKEPALRDLLLLDDGAFRQLFSGSPIKRIGRNRFIRNCLIAAGNSGEPALIDIVRLHLSDRDTSVRAMAVWALAQLVEPVAFDKIRQSALPTETHQGVRQEWGAPTQKMDQQ